MFVTDVPVLGPEAENAARRFISLVDEFYDRAVKLIVSAAAPVLETYRGAKLTFEFERTRSRLVAAVQRLGRLAKAIAGRRGPGERQHQRRHENEGCHHLCHGSRVNP